MTASLTPPDTDHGFAGLWHARYGEGIAPSPPAASNPVLQSLLTHRSVRAVDPAPLDEGTLEWLEALQAQHIGLR